MKKYFICVLIVFAAMTAFAQNDTIPARLKKSDNFSDYINKQLEYPILALENGLTGRVEFEFIITNLGCINSIKITSSPNVHFTREVNRVLEKTKCKWIPASLNGNPITSKMSSFVDFNIEQ